MQHRAAPKLTEPQPLFPTPYKEVERVVPDFTLDNGTVLEWDYERETYRPKRDAEFEQRPEPPATSRKVNEPEVLDTLPYIINGFKVALCIGFVVLVVGVVKVAFALIDVLVQGIYTEFMPAMFNAFSQAGYYLGIGIACVVAMMILAGLIKLRRSVSEVETSEATEKPTKNIFQWFIVNDAENAQQVVEQFKNNTP